MKTTLSATAEFLADGTLNIVKTIAGPAAGRQDPITIQAKCDGTVLLPTFNIPANTPASTQNDSYSHLPAGSVCTVTETQDGHTSTVAVTISGDGQQVTIPAGGTAAVDLTDTYTFLPGSLVVKKSIEGPAAGEQGPVTITVTCDGTALEPVFSIPTNAPAGIQTKQYDDIPAGSVCTLGEPDGGATRRWLRPPPCFLGPITIPAGQIVQADVTDTYNFNTGSLTVTKGVTGAPGGPIGITVTCVDPEGTSTILAPPISIPPGRTRHLYRYRGPLDVYCRGRPGW